MSESFKDAEGSPANEAFRMFAPESMWGKIVSGHESVRLDSGPEVWLCLEGFVDLFLVFSREEGKPGARQFLMRKSPGDLVFGTAEVLAEGSGSLLAIPSSDGRMVRLSAADFWERSRGPGARTAGLAVDAWMIGLSRVLVDRMAPTDARHFREGRHQQVEPGMVFAAPDHVVWIQTPAESFSLRGEIPLSTGDERTGPKWVPVVGAAWLVAADSREVFPRGTEDAMREGVVQDGLALLDRAVAPLFEDLYRARVEADRERLLSSLSAGESHLDSSIRKLDSVLTRRPFETVHAAGAASELVLVAAFETVAHAAGISLSENDLMRGIQKSRDPIVAMARAARVATRVVSLEGHWWQEDAGPMLAFAGDEREPVALLPTSAKSFEIFYPADGRRIPVSAASAARISEEAYSLYPGFAPRAIGVFDLLRLGLAGASNDLWVIAAAGMLGGLLSLGIPVLTSIVFDDVIPNAARRNLLQYTVLLVIAAAATSAFSYAQLVSLLRVRGKMDNRLQSAVWERLLGLPISFFRKFNAGDLALRAMGINSIASTAATTTLHSVFTGVFAIFSLGLMFYYSWELAILGIVMISLATVIGMLIIRLELRYQRPLQMKRGAIAGQVLQFIGGIAKLKVAGAEDRAFSAWAQSFSELKALSLKARSRGNAFAVFSKSFSLFSSATILIGISFFAQDMEVGNFAAFHTSYAQFAGGAMALLMAFSSMISIVPLYERAQPILQAIPETLPDAGDPGELRGRINFDQVSFRYAQGSKTILQHFSLEIAEGEFVAIVGPSGAGKSTIFRLLLGFETPESGTISFDDRNLAGLDLVALRRQLGVVLQDGKLMPGTVYENIVGSALIKEEAAWAAARVAGLEKFIKDLPMGMHTFVSEGAATFSGGQRQRLMIARAIVKKPKVLLFDEATSALDNLTQADVSSAIGELNATRVVIAHRLSTIIKADRIIVLGGGRLVESGTYEELMKKDGAFASLARRQIA